MSERKRQRSDDDLIDTPPNNSQIPPPKRARKDTNASAGRSLFVRSLPAIATGEALTELFSQSYPLKHATVVLDPATKQSKGYGFVTFADAEDAQKALDEFNGQNFLGRRMKIEIAQPRSREVGTKEALGGKKKSEVSAEAAASKRAREEKMQEARKPPKLIIRNLPWSIKTPEQLANLFRQFGKVKHSDLPKIKDTQAGFGFVVMRGRKNAEKALATINGTMVDGRTLAVDWAVDKEVWESRNKSPELGEGEHKEKPKKVKETTTHEQWQENENDDLANFMRNFGDELESEEGSGNENDSQIESQDINERNENEDFEDEDDKDIEEQENINENPQKAFITDNSSTLFVRNLPYTTLDADLKEHFQQFGPVRYARVVMDHATDRPRGTGFVCFFNISDADACFRDAPLHHTTGANATRPGDVPKVKHSLLENENADTTGAYTIEGRILQISKAVEKEKAVELAEEGTNFRVNRDKDKRKLYLLSEGTITQGMPLYASLSPSEIKMRQDSAMQRKKLIQNNPALHLSLTRLSIRNIPRNINSKDLKALAREAVVGFAKDVKDGHRVQLSKEEEARGGDDMREAEKLRKSKGKGIVRQSKVVFEGREGAKVSEDSGAGRSRGYGFVEYSSHRWALMGLRWLNGHQLMNASGKKQRLIVEFAIENAQVVQRRKEKENKARTRSKEVQEARKKGELPEKTKQPLSKNSLMKKTRVGTKAGIKVGKRMPLGRGTQEGKLSGKKPSKKLEGREKSKQSDLVREEGKLVKRAQIIQKKRMMRRNRKKGSI
jgi:nucleolar protein 4